MSTIPTYWAYFRHWLSCMKSCSEWFLVWNRPLQVFAHIAMPDIAVDLSKTQSRDHSLLTMKESVGWLRGHNEPGLSTQNFLINKKFTCIFLFFAPQN